MKEQEIKFKLDGKIVKAKLGETILDVAKRNGKNIPSLCHHPDLDVKATCRVCVVELNNYDKLITSCSTKVCEGMEVKTDSRRVKKARKMNLELIYASHVERCGACSYRFECDLLKYAKEYDLKINRFKDRKKDRLTYKFANAVEIDGSQCIDCGNCVEACNKEGISYLEMLGKGVNQEIKPKKDSKSACVYCGQCAVHCPVASAQEQDAVVDVEKIIKEKKKIIVAQFAPAVRVSIGELFSYPYGSNVEGLLTAALEKIGFNYIFDINFGADITTMTEAEEFMERLVDKKAVWPMTTSCCPAWVAYAEFYHPELLPHLTTARSPHIHSAGAIKTYWAKKMKINPKDIIVVSIVPCTAKKYEAARSELSLNGKALVDYVLTTREAAYLIKKNAIDLNKLKPAKLEPIFNAGSGAAAIYGTSGGVMESALRSVASFVCEKGKNPLCDARLEFKEVRGQKGLKEASVKLGNKTYKLAVISGLANVEKVLPKLKKYHYIEVMACSGGCLGGGGQPIPTTNKIREARMNGMYSLDKERKIRRAHENKAMLEYYNWVKESGLSSKLLHTKFKKTKSSILKTTKENRRLLFEPLF